MLYCFPKKVFWANFFVASSLSSLFIIWLSNKFPVSYHSRSLILLTDEVPPKGDSEDDLLLPTIHPNSVLPFHPKDLNYEDYVYEEYEDDDDLQDMVTQPFLPIPVTTAQPFLSKIGDSDTKPVFIENPVNSYIVRGASTSLKCKVVHADKAYFSCNGEAMAASEMHKEVDKIEISQNEEMEAINVKTLSLQLNRVDIEEFFGLYTCRCDAWSAKGMTSSNNATVEVACKWKHLKWDIFGPFFPPRINLFGMLLVVKVWKSDK